MESSQTNLKITYFLGAGASYNSIPIWKGQGQSMIDVSESVLRDINFPRDDFKQQFPNLVKNQIVIDFCNKLKKFGELAVEYGSIDIYARRLHLIDNISELADLKECLSVYFDLWENFIHRSIVLKESDDIYKPNTFYEKIDKRYFSLLSVLLEKRDRNAPRISENVSFITWNYDLQLETAFESFFASKPASINVTNRYLNFMNNDNDNDVRSEVVHLNGFRGHFINDNQIYETVEKKNLSSLGDYLSQFTQNRSQFRNVDYFSSIKYGWESNSQSIIKAKKIMEETNVLIIIGYSFPAFNRKIDVELIKEFEKGEGMKRIIYQDPYANKELLNMLFTKEKDIVIDNQNTNQFYIPHEFLMSK